METYFLKKLTKEDDLERVKKHLDFTIMMVGGHGIRILGKEGACGKFMDTNPDMFYKPKRRTDGE